MRKFLAIAGLVILASAAVAYAMGEANVVSGSWRYKMTVTVETPEGIKSGSAVREISVAATRNAIEVPDNTNPVHLKGEAVVVDLGGRGVLFALLKGGVWLEDDYAKSIVYYAFPYSTYTTVEGIEYYRSLKEGKEVLDDPALYPMLVTFTDLDDPKTVRAVLETGFADKKSKRRREDVVVVKDNFEELFGAGVRLKDITIEMTDEPVTWGIEKWLPWLPERKDAKGYLGSKKESPYADPTGTYLNGIELSTGRFWLIIEGEN